MQAAGRDITAPHFKLDLVQRSSPMTFEEERRVTTNSECLKDKEGLTTLSFVFYLERLSTN